MEYYKFYIVVKSIGLLMIGSLILMLAIFFIDALWKSYDETYRRGENDRQGKTY